MSVQGIKIAQQHGKEVVLADEVQHLLRLKLAAEAAEAEYNEAQERFIEQMELVGRKSLKDDSTKVTVVTRSIPRYDEKGLAKALGATLWNKVTKKTLDKAKLEKAVDEGEIDINVVAQHTTVGEAKPHLRFSAVLPDDEE